MDVAARAPTGCCSAPSSSSVIWSLQVSPTVCPHYVGDLLYCHRHDAYFCPVLRSMEREALWRPQSVPIALVGLRNQLALTRGGTIALTNDFDIKIRRCSRTGTLGDTWATSNCAAGHGWTRAVNRHEHFCRRLLGFPVIT
jgi:hypothetical protein